MKVTVKMLTTTDNPYNPFDQFDEWYGYDQKNKHCTCEYLARSCYTSPLVSRLEEIQTRNKTIEDIVRINATGMWKYVEREEEIDDGNSE